MRVVEAGGLEIGVGRIWGAVWKNDQRGVGTVEGGGII